MTNVEDRNEHQRSEPVHNRTEVSDAATADDSGFHIDVFMSGGLVTFTRKLADMAAQANEQQDVACLATATILTAAAALEAILSEFVYTINPSGYTKQFRKTGVPEKFRLATGTGLVATHPAVAELWDHRNAIGHSEPENPRSRFYGTRIDKAGAGWAISTVESFARALWGSNMPDWFRSDSGL